MKPSAAYSLPPNRASSRPIPFFGGAVGYLSYDLVREFETLPSMAKDDLQLPYLQFGLYDLITAIDHQTDRLQIIFCPPMERFRGEPREKLYHEGLDRLAECEARLGGRPAPSRTSLPQSDGLSPDQTREAYLNRVRRCQGYIAAGDTTRPTCRIDSPSNLPAPTTMAQIDSPTSRSSIDVYKRSTPRPSQGLCTSTMSR